MKMIEYNHFICHYYCHFFVYSHILLSGKTWSSGRSLLTSSDSFSKLISCSFPRSVPDPVYHQYGICRMYSEENPQDFRLSVPCLYPCERVVLFLSTEASFKPGGPFFWEFASKPPSSKAHLGPPFPCAQRMWILKGSSLAALPLRTKDVDIPYFVQNFLLALLAYMGSAATHLQPHILPLHS